jgi:glyoxylase-like metal-dependent hydrolase (beta-lactamase superfamily II)
MKIADGVQMLEISAEIMGNPSVIYPTLIWDEQTVMLVDVGFPGQAALFRAAIARAGIALERLNKIIFTHQDIDHIGGISGLLQSMPAPIEIIAHEVEKPYIQGERALIKFSPERIAALPEEQRQRMKHIAANIPQIKVSRTVGDGEILDCCGGVVIVSSAGHTPGHISLYHQPSKVLIAGDALDVADGRLRGPNPQYTMDMGLALNSLKKLARYDIETVICYHGGLCRQNVKQSIWELANGH